MSHTIDYKAMEIDYA